SDLDVAVDDEPSAGSDGRDDGERDGDVRPAERTGLHLVDVQRATLFTALRSERVDEQVGCGEAFGGDRPVRLRGCRRLRRVPAPDPRLPTAKRHAPEREGATPDVEREARDVERPNPERVAAPRSEREVA